MRIKSITYAMLRKTAPFENDRVEITAEVESNDSFMDVIEIVKVACEEALALRKKEPAPKHPEPGRARAPYARDRW